MARAPHSDPSPLASHICAGHFRAPSGYRIRRPVALADWTLVLTLNGTGRYFPPCEPHVFTDQRAGMLALVPPGVPHAVRAITDWNHFWVHFRARPHWQAWLEWPGHTCGVRVLAAPAGELRRTIRGAFQRVVDYTVATAPDRELFALNSLEELLLWCQRLQPQANQATPDSRIQACMDHLTRHFAQPIALTDLARLSRQSVSRISHRFRRQTGLSPMQYLEERRLERAMQLLAHTTMPVKEIAGAVGYPEPFYFTARFTRHTGYSPRAFRARTSRPTAILRRPHTPLNPEDRRLLRMEKGARTAGRKSPLRNLPTGSLQP